jgi:hypothetical protein
MRATLLLPLLITLGTRPLVAQPPRPAAPVVEAFILFDRIGESVWPGWGAAPTQLLLVTDSVEHFYRTPRSGEITWSRKRIFSPRFQATFPAVQFIPTIVIGTPAGTGTPADRWVLVALHEHFHQLQYSRPDYYARLNALGLARGDTTGMWALNFPFPYDSAAVQGAVRRWALAMQEALRAEGAGHEAAYVRAAELKRALDALLVPDDRTYFDFQLWQEGVPRWTELANARAGRRAGLVADSTLAWQEARLVDDLGRIDLGAQRREVVYPLGAAMAELLERRGVPWKARYFERMFVLELSAGS